jgi:hypothetical protein
MPGHVRGRKHLRLRAARDGEKALRPKGSMRGGVAQMPEHGRGEKHLRQRAAREAEKALMPEDSKEGGGH